MMIILAQDAGTIHSWEKYGLSGLVIMALFASLAYFLKRLMQYQDSQSVEHVKERADWRRFAEEQTNLHRTERLEWRKDIEKYDNHMEQRDARLHEALSDLANRIHDHALVKRQDPK